MKYTTLCMTKQVSSDERHIPLIPSTSCTTSLISLQQMDSNYRYPVNYYHVDKHDHSHSYPKQWLHSKNARANKSGTRHIKMVCSYRLPHQHPQVRKLHLTNLRCLHCPCLPCNNISMQITRILRRDGCLKSVRTVGKTDTSWGYR